MEGMATTRDELLTKTELIEKFGVVNYLVFSGMLGISAFIGIFFWCRGNHNTEEILMGDRNMSTLPMTMSLIASFMSAIILLGLPAEMYASGTMYVVLVLSYPVVMAATEHFYLPVFFELKVCNGVKQTGRQTC